MCVICTKTSEMLAIMEGLVDDRDAEALRTDILENHIKAVRIGMSAEMVSNEPVKTLRESMLLKVLTDMCIIKWVEMEASPSDMLQIMIATYQGMMMRKIANDGDIRKPEHD